MSKPYSRRYRRCQYEIMLVVDGEMGLEEARSAVSPLLSLLSDKEEYEENVMVSHPLAYPMKGKTVGHMFVLNFALEDASVLEEFRRLSLLNKSVLRQLVINLTKDKGYRAKNNPKKVKDFEIRQEKKKQYIENKKSLTGTFVISNAS